jgi:VanZ family protein
MIDWLVFGAALVAVVVACLIPNRYLPRALPNDKLMHGVAFAVLTVLALRQADSGTQMLYWLGGLLLAGWLIECLQQLVPDRDFSWRDMAANVAGIAAVAVPWAMLQLL